MKRVGLVVAALAWAELAIGLPPAPAWAADYKPSPEYTKCSAKVEPRGHGQIWMGIFLCMKAELARQDRKLDSLYASLKSATAKSAPGTSGAYLVGLLEAGERPQGQAPNRPRFDKPRKSFNDDKKPFEGKKFAGKRDRDDWKEHRPREKREAALDPDSPWAALAALRSPKTE